MSRTMSYGMRKILSPCLGTLLLIMLLLLASLNSGVEVKPLTKITIHKVRIFSPPPKPPPAPERQQGSPGAPGAPGAPGPSLARAKTENPVKLTLMNLKEGIDSGSISGFSIGGPGSGFGGLGSGFGGPGSGRGGLGRLGIVRLSKLDWIPMVRYAPILTHYPKKALRMNIRAFNVIIDIIIDEEGRTYPVRILLNPFPSVNEEIMNFASKVRFTPPVKQGVPVKTEYAWPLLITKP